MIHGIGASAGIAIGTAFVWKKSGYAAVKDHVQTAINVEDEKLKFYNAVDRAIEDVQSLIRESKSTITETERDLLEMQSEMLSDSQLRADVAGLISERQMGAVAAVWEVCDELIRVLGELDSEYLQARAGDVRASAEHIIRHIRGESPLSVWELPANSVVVADDISPLEALSMDLSHVAGIVTRFGGSTSHSAILARARNIPAVVACGDALTSVTTGASLAIDGLKGIVWRDPSSETRQALEHQRELFRDDQKKLASLVTQSATTTDGTEIRLMANIAGPEDLKDAIHQGAAGVGLFRTELVFMNRATYPTEEEQFETYKQVALDAEGKPVTVRTLDIGGDKPVGYLQIPREENPFLGYRAIRISLDQPLHFQEQLRAILRASAFGDLRVMFPMIGTLNEFRQAKNLLSDAMGQLRSQGVAFKEDMLIGVMIETPAAALIADVLAKEADFFSIGTNDLCQYTLAVDRGNEKVKTLYDPFHPAVLRLIANTIEQASKHHIEVSLCGEMAADVHATLLFIGMGLRTFSMSPPAISAVKRAVREASHVRALQVAADVMDMGDSLQIKEYLNNEVLNRRA
jgi:phosphotransferase system enzyme I (PtsI)